MKTEKKPLAYTISERAEEEHILYVRGSGVGSGIANVYCGTFPSRELAELMFSAITQARDAGEALRFR